ncbi:MAG: hypothetical protein IKD92_00185, partial [Lachnospiraceae bacterium]|nr:hypothetical protein [Lachnospiraceae bacterium]
LAAVCILFSIMSDTDSLNMNLLSMIITIGSVGYLLATLRKVAGWQRSIPRRQPIFAVLFVLAAVLLNAAVVFISPVNDIWYYMGDAVCILILLIAAVLMLQTYNISTTRPLPRLFDREEVR